MACFNLFESKKRKIVFFATFLIFLTTLALLIYSFMDKPPETNRARGLYTFSKIIEGDPLEKRVVLKCGEGNNITLANELQLKDLLTRQKFRFQSFLDEDDESEDKLPYSIGVDHWLPKWTTSEMKKNLGSPHKVVIIVPFRNRCQQAKLLLPYLHNFLQSIPHHILIVEQMDSKPFNRGFLLNIGTILSEQDPQTKNADYFIFHDVDLLPEHPHNSYQYSPWPIHRCGYLSEMEYDLIYDGNFGGITQIDKSVFFKVNGFTNLCWGWGGEDDEFAKRIKEFYKGPSEDEDTILSNSKFKRGYFRPPKPTGHIFTLVHDRKVNVQLRIRNFFRFLQGGASPESDGVEQSRSQFSVLDVQRPTPWISWAKVAISAPSPDFVLPLTYDQLIIICEVVNFSTIVLMIVVCLKNERLRKWIEKTLNNAMNRFPANRLRRE